MEEGGKMEVYNALGKYKLFQGMSCCPNRNEAVAICVEAPRTRKNSQV